ncbi:hypothetical protein [Aliikangiella sp. IMCC44359]|uniref:hypothetical protein n=1 Tax=Aliikangiella sp. IMCC44359 TaxID=3459125 RepID=UPI00403B2938
MNAIVRLYLVLCSSILFGCSSPIENYINTKFPAIAIEDQRAEAITNFQSNIDKLVYPTIAFQADLNTIKNELMAQVLSDKGITALALSSDKQLLNAMIDFDIALAEHSDHEIITRLSPRVIGKLSIYLGATIDFAHETGMMNIRLLPNLSQIKLDAVIIDDSVDVTVVGNIIASALTQYADNISGELSRLDIMKISIPSEYTKSFSLSDSLKDTKFGDDVSIEFEDKQIDLKYALNTFVLSLHSDKLGGIVDFYNSALYEAEGSLSQALKYNSTYESPYDVYNLALKDMLSETPIPGASWVAVSKSVISTFVSEVVEQGQLCSKVTTSATETFSEKIDMPDGAGMSCTIDRDCRQSRNCDVHQSHDSRNCRACLVKNPFGGCIVRGNDPICETAKAAQNAAYAADAAARKLDCERIKEQNRMICEAEKAAEKGLCETAKGALNAIGRTGNFANVKADIGIKGDAKLCLTHTTFDPQMSEINAGIRVSGRLSTNVDFEFTPLDIIGHLTCPFPWTEDYKVTATMKAQSLAIQSNVNLEVDGSRGRYEYTVDPIKVDLALDPPPANLLLEILGSTNMSMACPVVGVAVAPITIPLRQVLPPLGNEFTVESPELSGSGNFDLPSFTIASKESPLKVQVRDHVVLLYTGEK